MTFYRFITNRNYEKKWMDFIVKAITTDDVPKAFLFAILESQFKISGEKFKIHIAAKSNREIVIGTCNSVGIVRWVVATDEQLQYKGRS